MTELGINVDHVATLRNARGGAEPDPVAAALAAELAGADSIVCHLREDRRHMRDRDVQLLRQVVKTSLQLEMAATPEMLKIALEIKPHEALLVPERRKELTTEGGLDCTSSSGALRATIKALRAAGILVSVFIDADSNQVEAARKLGASAIELHTGPYAHARGAALAKELEKLETAAHRGWECDLAVHAGHGLNYRNIAPLLKRLPVERVNIGHSVVSRAVFTGFESAVREMKALVAGRYDS